MSQSNVEKVRKLVFDDPVLKKRVEASQGEDGIVQALMQIGSEKGLAFTQGDVDAWRKGEAAKHELSDEQLGEVAGGLSVAPDSLSPSRPSGPGGLITPAPGGRRPGPSAAFSYGSSTMCTVCGSGTYSG